MTQLVHTGSATNTGHVEDRACDSPKGTGLSREESVSCFHTERRSSTPKLRQWTERFRPDGRSHYPQCQHVDKGKQCEKSTYADGKCWSHQK